MTRGPTQAQVEADVRGKFERMVGPLEMNQTVDPTNAALSSLSLPFSTLTSGRKRVFEKTILQAHVCCVMSEDQVPGVIGILQQNEKFKQVRNWIYAYRIDCGKNSPIANSPNPSAAATGPLAVTTGSSNCFLSANSSLANGTSSSLGGHLDGNIYESKSKIITGYSDGGEQGAGGKLLNLLSDILGLENLMIIISRWDSGLPGRLGPRLYSYNDALCRELLRELKKAVVEAFPEETLRKEEENLKSKSSESCTGLTGGDLVALSTDGVPTDDLRIAVMAAGAQGSNALAVVTGASGFQHTQLAHEAAGSNTLGGSNDGGGIINPNALALLGSAGLGDDGRVISPISVERHEDMIEIVKGEVEIGPSPPVNSLVDTASKTASSRHTGGVALTRPETRTEERDSGYPSQPPKSAPAVVSSSESIVTLSLAKPFAPNKLHKRAAYISSRVGQVMPGQSIVDPLNPQAGELYRPFKSVHNVERLLSMNKRDRTTIGGRRGYNPAIAVESARDRSLLVHEKPFSTSLKTELQTRHQKVPPAFYAYTEYDINSANYIGDSCQQQLAQYNTQYQNGSEYHVDALGVSDGGSLQSNTNMQAGMIHTSNMRSMNHSAMTTSGAPAPANSKDDVGLGATLQSPNEQSRMLPLGERSFEGSFFVTEQYSGHDVSGMQPTFPAMSHNGHDPIEGSKEVSHLGPTAPFGYPFGTGPPAGWTHTGLEPGAGLQPGTPGGNLHARWHGGAGHSDFGGWNGHGGSYDGTHQGYRYNTRDVPGLEPQQYGLLKPMDPNKAYKSLNPHAPYAFHRTSNRSPTSGFRQAGPSTFGSAYGGTIKNSATALGAVNSKGKGKKGDASGEEIYLNPVEYISDPEPDELDGTADILKLARLCKQQEAMGKERRAIGQSLEKKLGI